MLSILTVNLRFDTEDDGVFSWSNRRDSMQTVVQSCRPDIIATQEGRHPQIVDFESLLPDMQLVDEHRDWIEHRMYPCIYVRHERFSVVASGDVWLSGTPHVAESQLSDSNYPRLLSWARLNDVIDGGEVVVGNVHLDNAGPDVRRRQVTIAADTLRELAGDIPIVFCGDFNDGPESDVYAAVTDRIPHLYDPWRHSRRRERSTVRGFGNSAERNATEFVAPRIDWILLDRRLTFERIDRVDDEPGGTPPSDHYPVLCSGIGTEVALIRSLSRAEPVVWHNPSVGSAMNPDVRHKPVADNCPLDPARLADAESRMRRYESVLPVVFPGISDDSRDRPDLTGGILNSSLRELTGLSDNRRRVFAKCDHELPVAGSIKARGGFYEVFRHAEGILDTGLTRETDFPVPALSGREIVVASTGNLGLSVGLLGRALGFSVTVVMSRDAKNWKKELLRSRGAVVQESQGDYTQAVAQARASCDASSADEDSDIRKAARYFIDDERSPYLFLGYACAARELLQQLEELGLNNAETCVYLPCGVGGAPGGIAWALRTLARDRVDAIFCEPVEAPSMLLALLERRHAKAEGRELTSMPHVESIGLSARTEADGLAVGAASPLAVDCTEHVVRAALTLQDADLISDMRTLWRAHGIRVEPSAAASYSAFRALECDAYVHILWLTGGGLLPETEFARLIP